MPCTITDKLLDASGTAQDGLAVYAWPQDNTIRVKDGGGALRPIQPQSGLPIPYQYGKSASSSGGGNYSFTLPKSGGSAEQDPASSYWYIRLPDGKTYRGIPPTVNGPLTIEDLISTYSWDIISGQVATIPSNGTEAAGEVSVVAQTYYDVAFATALSSPNYEVSVGLQEDQAPGGGGGQPAWNWTSRTINGIRIQFSQAYTGIMTFRCKVY